MALLYRFPLNNNLKNIGVCNGNLTAVGSASLNTTIGKFGKSYYFPSSSYLRLATPDVSKFSTEVSMSVWVMFPATKSTWTQTVVLGTPGTSWTNILCGLDINSAGLVYFNTSNGSSFKYINASTRVDDGKWHNIIGVFDGSSSYIYIDGVLISSAANTITPAFSSATNLFVGGNSGGEMFVNGYLNDARIYNHSLSKKEIWEISRGLANHLKFNGKVSGNSDNILCGGSCPYSAACSSSGITVNVSGGTLNVTTTSSNNGNWVVMYFNNKDTTDSLFERFMASGQYYTFSFDCKIVDGSGLPQVFINDGNSYVSVVGDTTLVGQWQRVYFSRAYNGKGTSYGWLTPHLGVNGILGSWQCKNFKIELETNPNPTWSPCFYDFKDTGLVEYDGSGFGNNAGLSAVALSKIISNGPFKGMIATDLPTLSVTHPRAVNNNDQEWTCCAWICLKTESASQRLNNMNQGNYIVYATSGTYARKGLLYLNSGDNDYYTYGSRAIAKDEWVHVAFVFRNTDGLRKIYVNGVDSSAGGPNKTYTPYGIPDPVYIFPSVNGLIYDYREYATALSADDVKEVYNAYTSIDKNGNLFCNEIKEV